MKDNSALKLLCITALLSILLAFNVFAMPGDVNQMNANANLRSGPGSSYQVIDCVPAGTTVGIRETRGAWTYIEYNGNLGWVYSKLIGAQAVSGNTAAPAAASSYTEHTVIRKVNLREAADISSTVFVVLNPGMKGLVDSDNGTWAHCYYGNYEGYCYPAYIDGLSASQTLTAGETNGPGSGNGTITPAPPAAETDSVYNGFDYSNVYSYQYYRNHNTDLIAAFGNDSRKYIRHFVENGMDEGRQARASFNVYSYMNGHSSLRARFGNDLKRYYLYACGYYS